MNRDRGIIVAALAFSALCLTFAGLLQPRILRERTELQLTANPEVLENLPPALAVTQVSMGALRGLVLDYLWIRALRLEEERKYHESSELARWITRMQPRFAGVWDFLSWNLAYNLSVAAQTPEEQWHWVSEGLRLLRDEGLKHNPRNAALYQRLADLFFHRIGKYASDSHWYFKLRHAEEWQIILGAPPEGGAVEVRKAFQPIAEAPLTEEELREPAASAARKLREHGFALDRTLLNALYDLEKLAALDALAPWRDEAAPVGRTEQELRGMAREPRYQWLREWQRSPAEAPGREAVLAFVRARVLRRDYRMDPKLMCELLETSGPMDWRHAAAHSIYWGVAGARECARGKKPDLFTILQTERIILHSIQDLARTGQVTWDPLSNAPPTFGPDPGIFDAYEKVLREASERHKNDPGTTPIELRDSHRGFLELAASKAWLYGAKDEAARYYQRLLDTYGRDFPDQYPPGVPLAEFAKKQLRKDYNAMHLVENITELVGALCLNAVVELGFNRQERAQNFLAIAAEVYRDYAKENPDWARMKLPSFPEIFANALARVLLAPAGRVPPRLRAQAWHKAPLEYRQAIWDRVRKPLYTLAAKWGLKPETAFPEPPGMDEYRRAHPPPREKPTP
jgi:hypothetical protein